jgi:hypothetical protein
MLGVFTCLGCELNPASQSVVVTILNDTPSTMIIDHCEDEKCHRVIDEDRTILPPGGTVKASTSARDVANPRRVVDRRTGNVVGCLPLRYADHPAGRPVVMVSSAAPC